MNNIAALQELTDAVTFATRTVLAPHVSRLMNATSRERWDYSAQPYKPTGWIDRIEVTVKTERTAAWGDDWDALGTADPSDKALEAVKAIAESFGFADVTFEPCEKGYGDFVFQLKQPVRK